MHPPDQTDKVYHQFSREDGYWHDYETRAAHGRLHTISKDGVPWYLHVRRKRERWKNIDRKRSVVESIFEQSLILFPTETGSLDVAVHEITSVKRTFLSGVLFFHRGLRHNLDCIDTDIFRISERLEREVDVRGGHQLCVPRWSSRCDCVDRWRLEWQYGELQVNVIRSNYNRLAHEGDLERESEDQCTVLDKKLIIRDWWRS